MARPQVPEFGNWESDEIPYTTYFDNARKGKKSGQIHQIDPQENIVVEQKVQKASEGEMLRHERQSSREEVELRRPSDSPNAMSHKPNNTTLYGSNKLDVEAPKVPEEFRTRHERRFSREEGEMRRLTESPLRHEATGRVNSPHYRNGGSSASDTPRRVGRQSGGSDRSSDPSPLHPRVGGKATGISSPSWERKVSSEGSHGLVAPSTPGRSRLRSVTRGDDSPDRGPAVPKFGEWDETDPSSAEGYTQVFNRVREEKHSEAGKVPVMPTEASYSNAHRQFGNDNAKGCGCFPWGKR